MLSGFPSDQISVAEPCLRSLPKAEYVQNEDMFMEMTLHLLVRGFNAKHAVENTKTGKQDYHIQRRSRMNRILKKSMDVHGTNYN